MTTTYEAGPGMVAYLARIWPARCVISLVAGTGEPPFGPARSGEVPTVLRQWLLASFNGGFKYAAASGGFIAQGVSYAPMQRGLATLVVTWNHHADVVTWTGRLPIRSLRVARQNLGLLVNAGRPVLAASNNAQWGATIGPATVWRTGIGVDRNGDLIYAAESNATALGLADVLVRAGAVRGMELDINPDWPSFNLYAGAQAASPTQFVPNPNQSPARYLTPDDRDFFTISGYASR